MTTSAAPAAGYHPEVQRFDVRAPATLDEGSLGRFLAELLGDAARAESVLHHRGLWHAGRNWSGEGLPADAPLTIYAFTREPAAVTLPEPFVLWEAGDLVALHKPAWLPVQGTRASRLFSLEHVAARLLDAPSLTAVHRLDRETSGVVLFARTGAAAARLHRQFRSRTVRKTYLGVVAPGATAAPPPAPFAVRGGLRRIPHPAHARFALVEAGGEWSETWFAPPPPGALAPRTFPAIDARMLPVLARPLTGRTHQIRVHLASQGLALCGDTLYGPPTGPAGGAAERLQLHALSLAFQDGARALTVQAPTPPDLLWGLPGRPTAGLVGPDETREIESLFSDAPRIALGFGR